MKWILAAYSLILIVLMCIICAFYFKLTSLSEQLADTPSTSVIEARLDKVEEQKAIFVADISKAISGMHSRLDALEAGRVEKQPRGNQSPEVLLVDLERQIHKKKNAAMMPDEEMAAHNEIQAITLTLKKLSQEGKDVITPLVERIKITRDPNVQAEMIRDVSPQLGGGMVPKLMELFRDKTFASNLRVLAAEAALKAGGEDQALLAEFTNALKDPEEFLVVKTGLVNRIFKEVRYEAVVDPLLDGAKNPGYAPQHRIACLLAINIYDHPKVLRALEEIIFNVEEDPHVINLSIQAYEKLMGKECVPFLKTVLEQEKLDNTNRIKILGVIKIYEEEE